MKSNNNNINSYDKKKRKKVYRVENWLNFLLGKS